MIEFISKNIFVLKYNYNYYNFFSLYNMNMKFKTSRIIYLYQNYK